MNTMTLILAKKSRQKSECNRPLQNRFPQLILTFLSRYMDRYFDYMAGLKSIDNNSKQSESIAIVGGCQEILASSNRDIMEQVENAQQWNAFDILVAAASSIGSALISVEGDELRIHRKRAIDEIYDVEEIPFGTDRLDCHTTWLCLSDVHPFPCA